MIHVFTSHSPGPGYQGPGNYGETCGLLFVTLKHRSNLAYDGLKFFYTSRILKIFFVYSNTLQLIKY